MENGRSNFIRRLIISVVLLAIIVVICILFDVEFSTVLDTVYGVENYLSESVNASDKTDYHEMYLSNL